MAILILIVLVVGIIFFYGPDTLASLIYPPALYCIFFFPIVMLISSHLGGDFLRGIRIACQRNTADTVAEMKKAEFAVKITGVTVMLTGLLLFLLDLFVTTKSLTITDKLLLVNVSASFISVLYAVCIDIMLTIVYAVIKKRELEKHEE